MSNRLKNQSSPYLRQHADNPVNWYPWGEEAFEAARREDKPIFLSIGYSTCHWCHVMARESFENEEIAGILNHYFISIKVDREERPDVDSVYMAVCQALTGSGGWPMSVFMTAEQKPFFAGTYFPPVARPGMIGFRELLMAVAERWQDDRESLLASSQEIVNWLARENQETRKADQADVDRTLPEQGTAFFVQSFDRKYGGFGAAPKFPTPHSLLFLTFYASLRDDMAASEAVQVTLQQMRRGGIFDQIGYGFSRYSTDGRFFAPHFEKMLYDNALLILAYAAAGKVFGDAQFVETAEQTAEYLFREMMGAEGAFASAQDADSEGEEGKFYLWTREEVFSILGSERGAAFCEYFDITEQGNFAGKNIPNLLPDREVCREFEEERRALCEYRLLRMRLHRDDKVLTVWNSLAIGALVVLYRVTGKRPYFEAAERARQFIEKELTEGDTLYVSILDGVRSVPGFLDDYAFYGAALTMLYEAAGEDKYLERAKEIAEEAERQFADPESGGYFLYGEKNGLLIARPKETYDGAIPSGNSMMAYLQVRLAQITGEEIYRERAERQLAFLSGQAKEYPAGSSLFLLTLLLHENPPYSCTVVPAEGETPERIITRIPLCAAVRILEGPEEGYERLDGRTTYYICKGNMCLPPTTEIG